MAWEARRLMRSLKVSFRHQTPVRPTYAETVAAGHGRDAPTRRRHDGRVGQRGRPFPRVHRPRHRPRESPCPRALWSGRDAAHATGEAGGAVGAIVDESLRGGAEKTRRQTGAMRSPVPLPASVVANRRSWERMCTEWRRECVSCGAVGSEAFAKDARGADEVRAGGQRCNVGPAHLTCLVPVHSAYFTCTHIICVFFP